MITAEQINGLRLEQAIQIDPKAFSFRDGKPIPNIFGIHAKTRKTKTDENVCVACSFDNSKHFISVTQNGLFAPWKKNEDGTQYESDKDIILVKEFSGTPF